MSEYEQAALPTFLLECPLHILRHRGVPTLERHYPRIDRIPIQYSRRRCQWQALRKLPRRFEIALSRAKFFGGAMGNEAPPVLLHCLRNGGDAAFKLGLSRRRQ